MSDKNKTSNNPPNTILEGEEKLLLDHNYDGIQELDYPLPRWWLAILYITIVFGIGYGFYYLTGIGPSHMEQLNADLRKIEENKPKVAAPAGGDQELVAAAMKNPGEIKKGSEVYTGKCAACHADKGQGLIGPNLTDDHWLHGDGTPSAVAKVIREGVPEKGMPPWGPILTPDEVIQVVAFIRSIHGTNPAGAKEAQGVAHPFTEL